MSAEEVTVLLERLEALIRGAGCPVPDYLAPGAPAAEIEDAFGLVGLTPPPEAVAIFTWHDGYLPGVHPHPFWLLPHEVRPLSLRGALLVYEAVNDGYERPTWMPVMEGIVLMDTARIDDRGRSPIARLLHGEGWQQEAASIATPLQWWITLIEEGAWTWGVDGWVDHLNHLALPPDQQATSLVD
jgi:hypothetical protein